MKSILASTLSKPIFALVAALLVATSAAAQSDAAMGDGGKLRLVENPSGTIAYVRYVIQKFGLDKKHDFQLERVPAANVQAVTNAMRSDGGDIATADFVVISRLRNAGTGVVAVAPLLAWNDQLVVSPGSGIETVADFKGKKIGTPNGTASPWLIVQAVARKVYGVDLNKEATVQEGNIALLRGMLEQGQLDASYMFDNLSPELVATGKFRVMTDLSALVAKLGIPADTPYVLMMASTSYAAAHPANVRAYLAACREAIRILRTDDALWTEIGPVMNISPNLLVAVRDQFRKPLLSTFKPTTEAALQKTFSVLLDTAGADTLGLDKLPVGFMTLDYQ